LLVQYFLMKKALITCFILLSFGTTFAQTTVARPDSTITQFFKREKGLVAADGGYTIPLSNGKVMWIFGDSYMDDYDSVSKTVPCLFGSNNSVLLQPKGDWDWRHTQTLPASEGSNSFFKAQPGNFIWPMTGFQHGDTVYILCLNMKRIGTSQYDLKNVGDTWAKIYVPTMRIVSYSPLQNFNDIGFSQGFIKEGGFMYNYGLKNNKIYVARFPENEPNAPWSFWDGSNWVGDINKIVAIADAPGFSVYFCKVKNRYVYLSTEFSLNCDAGKDIYVSGSASITGPFSPRKVIYTIPNDKQGHRPFFYGPLAHPEYINSKNELLIDYSINGYAPCIPSCVDGKFDPNNYRPRAIWLPLKSIGAGL
jgi:hypothetical protein